MRTIYTSDLISKPEIKKILDEFINYPVIDNKPCLIIDKTTDYNKTSLGNAVEFLLELLISNNSKTFNTALKKYEKHFRNTLNNYKKQYKNLDEYYLLPTNNYGSFGVITKKELDLYPSNLLKNPQDAVKINDLVDDFNKAMNILKSKNCFENEIKTTLFSILIIANIIPLCKRFNFFNINYRKITDSTIENLNKIFENFPKNFHVLGKKIISEPQIFIGGTIGRPDFIIGNTLLEVKSTQEYLTKSHLRQIAIYYLGLKKESIIEIEEIAIFYSLYGKMELFKPEDIFNLNLGEEIIQKIDSYSK